MFKDFMKNRHGVDEFSVFLTRVAIVLMVVSIFVKSNVISAFSLVIVIYGYFRVFSTNILQRNSENYKFLSKFWNPIKKSLRRFKRHTFGEKGYKYFYCKNCHQELRAPKHKGKINVKCPKCKEKFEIRT